MAVFGHELGQNVALFLWRLFMSERFLLIFQIKNVVVLPIDRDLLHHQLLLGYPRQIFPPFMTQL